jgi:UDP-glucose 4-epimerase
LYAKSKYKAEQELLSMQDEDFCVAIVRAPMAYGAGCPGNFQSLVHIAQRFPVFPAVKNQRSLIYIEHLAAFFDLLIQNTSHGIFFPQNREYVSTQEMVSILAQQMNKTIHFSRFLGLLVVLARPFVGKVKKAFGSLIYSDMEDFAFQYSSFELEQTLRRSVPDEEKN